jgi:hypothetical protein
MWALLASSLGAFDHAMYPYLLLFYLNCQRLRLRVFYQCTPGAVQRLHLIINMLPRQNSCFLQSLAWRLQYVRSRMENERLHCWKQASTERRFPGEFRLPFERPEKGKPSERAGRKATGLSHEKARDTAAGPPGESSASERLACLVNHYRRVYYGCCYSLFKN